MILPFSYLFFYLYFSNIPGFAAAYLSSTSSELMVNQVFRDLARGDQGL